MADPSETPSCPVAHDGSPSKDGLAAAHNSNLVDANTILTKFAKARAEAVTSLGSETMHPFLQRSEREYTSNACTYWDYIHPETLTSLQEGREGKGLNHHEEHLFIIVHQVFELWFKQVLFDLRYVIDTLRDEGSVVDSVHLAIYRLRRANVVLRNSISGFDMMETMDPVDFLEFRDWLSPASGFQSVQMRQLEILFGLEEDDRICKFVGEFREAFVSATANKNPMIDEVIGTGTLKDSVLTWLEQVDLGEQVDLFMERFLEFKNEQHKQQLEELDFHAKAVTELKATGDLEGQLLQQLRRTELSSIKEKRAAFKEQHQHMLSFFTDPDLGTMRCNTLFILTFRHYDFCSRLADLTQYALDFEMSFAMWRIRHARMVERMIGRRVGTGGSSGVDYLDSTAKYRVFQDIAYCRAIALPPSLFPQVVTTFASVQTARNSRLAQPKPEP